ncbi:MAG: hypothetical protein QM734_13490 [Cyclobacteriaceae bacterium]
MLDIFLIEAAGKGYFVTDDMLKRWKKYQRNKSQGWRRNNEYYSNELTQAYRLIHTCTCWRCRFSVHEQIA